MSLQEREINLVKKLASILIDDKGGEKVEKNFVNPTAAALMDLAGYAVTDPSGNLIAKDIIADFNRNDQVTGQKAKEVLDLIFNKSAFFQNFSVVYGDELTIPIDIHAGLKEQLISTVRAGTQTSAASRELMYVLGMELYLLQVELQKDIPMKLIRNHLYDPNFEQMIDDSLSTELANDFLRLATNGYADSYSAIGGNFYTLAIGHEKILQTANGSWTNSNGTSIVIGYFGDRVTPNKVDLGKAATGIASATDAANGNEIMTVMDRMIESVPDDYVDDPNMVFVMSRVDAEKYADARSFAVAVKDGGLGNATNDLSVNNVLREQWRTSGIIPSYKGRRILINPMKKSIGTTVSGSEVKPNIYLANLKEFYVGMQRKIESSREYEPRSSAGGSAIEITKHFWIDFQVRNKEACVIAFYGATCETPVLMDDSTKKATAYSDTEAFTETTNIYPYCDTKGVRLFVGVSKTNLATAQALVADLATAVAALGTGDGTTQELTQGSAVSIAEISATKTYYVFRAFKDGYLTKSSTISVNVD